MLLFGFGPISVDFLVLENPWVKTASRDWKSQEADSILLWCLKRLFLTFGKKPFFQFVKIEKWPFGQFYVAWSLWMILISDRGILYLYLQSFAWITFLVNSFFYRYVWENFWTFCKLSLPVNHLFSILFQLSSIENQFRKNFSKERMDLPAISLREIGFQKNDDVALCVSAGGLSHNCWWNIHETEVHQNNNKWM